MQFKFKLLNTLKKSWEAALSFLPLLRLQNFVSTTIIAHKAVFRAEACPIPVRNRRKPQ